MIQVQVLDRTLYTHLTELTFKRHFLSSAMGKKALVGPFFARLEKKVDIWVYTDESGVFDHKHENYYVFGGVIFLSKEEKDNEIRKYKNAEKAIRKNQKYKGKELKACRLSNKEKGKLFRSMNSCFRFGVVIRQKSVYEMIFSDKKSKQRYLDYAYKICLKEAFKLLINQSVIVPDDVSTMNIFVDEHSTATNGKYELKEGLEEEFKRGTYNRKWTRFYPPLFKNLKSINLRYCDSKKMIPIRMADIIANRIYYYATKERTSELNGKVQLTYLP